ncbi:uncharacterized protein PFL1_01852 [Pseudozyma flocculosa PF-1]|uniref:Related to Tumor susceptibility gene 101 protein n=1 Tax=Pseudozyma flocculosa TaxID=84751 RepID=A0A5C3F0G1_9BASI|nr:uncharacterized protein PFL1_01852 [Pseudozyma flocculosa PF-1]EPQ30326.1 hypothetical protein PFL1_01852 [Pseudozyma flocculosa PF-1]SPO37396.1 related to Tumor susceptibility gene 101 protein [Pseudozyma flocculosa]
MDHAVVQRWLRQVLAPYSHPQRTYLDLDAALVALSSLSPSTEPFTYNDGRTHLLVTLTGTIPVHYRGATYNIPVQFWIPKDYPDTHPIAYVVPTPDMLVRKGPNLDPSGEIGGPYLARWNAKPEACNLLDLIRDCQHIFGQQPPVYAKPREAANPGPATPTHQPSPGPSHHASAAQYDLRQQQQQPPLPPQPQSFATQGNQPINGDARQRPPPPAPQPHHDPSASSRSPSASPAPHRPPKPAQSPEALVSQDPRYGLHLNGNRNSYAYGQPAPPPHLAPHRSASGDFSSVGAAPASPLQGPSRHQHGPGRSSSPHISSTSMHLSPGHEGRPGQHRQSWDDRAPAPQPYSQPAPFPPHRHQQPQQQPHFAPPAAGTQDLAPQSPASMRSHPAPSSAAAPSYQQQQQQHQQPPHLPQQQQPAYTSSPQYQQRYQQHGQPQQPPLAPHPPQHPMQPPGAHASSAAPTSQQPLPPKHRQANLMDALDDDDDGGGGGGGTIEDHSRGGPTSRSLAGSASAATGAPPPPRPPNPELLAMHDRLLSKIDSRLSALSASLSQSNQHLEVLSADLDRGRPAIEDEMRRLEAVRDVCRVTGDRVEATVVEAQKRIEWLRSKEDPDVDGMVLATSIVGNQLVDLVAEDNAIEDTLYQLGRALNAERIELDRFLKQTRMLAREQFMKRALAHKIVEGMGWHQ